MIIGISGKIGSGKDLVGNIIQCLIAYQGNVNNTLHTIEYNIIDKIQIHETRFPNNTWQIKKWADKLKNIVCIILNCTREQLEDRDFKETELGEEWIVYSSPNGLLFKDEYLSWDKINQSYCNIYKLTPRKLLQLLGTECGRQIIHPNIWVNATMADYKPFIENYPNLIKSNGKDLVEGKDYSMGKAIYPNWVITDVRFPNEAKAIKDHNGINIRVNRLGDGIYQQVQHLSETALDNYKFDYVIDNNGTIEELVEKVKEILIKEKII